MSDLAPGRFTESSLSDPRWDLAQRVAESHYFRKGPKIRAFLLYLCENAILGRVENLTAQLIGAKVFGRHPDYKLSEDNIVRVEARELRKRLEAYFSAEGRDEPMVIEIPKGTYVPVFRLRGTGEPEGEEPAEEGPRTWASKWFAAIAAAAALFAAASAWLAIENARLRREPPAVPSEFRIYSDLFGTLGTVPQRQTLLVTSNPNVVMYFGAESERAGLQQSPEQTVRAPAELKKTFGFAMKRSQRDLPYQFLSLTTEEFTGIGEAVGAFHLGRLMQTLGRSVHLTQSRFLNWDHVQKQDLILLGGPQSNDWSYQDEAKSNFVFSTGGFDNLKPLAGEQSRYSADLTPKPKIDYGVIKMLTSPYGFNTLLVAGLTSAGTAGASEFLATPRNMAEVHRRLAAGGARFPANWEVLLRVAVRSGLPLQTTPVAFRPDSQGR